MEALGEGLRVPERVRPVPRHIQGDRSRSWQRLGGAVSGGAGTARAAAHRDAIEMMRPPSEPNEKLPAGIEPDVILPVQFFTRLQPGTAWSGEQRLMAAVLDDAFTVCSSPAPPATATKRGQVQREAMRWLRSNDRAWIFSFLRVCETLDLDPGTIRRRVYLRRAEACPPNGPPGVSSAPVSRRSASAVR